MKQIFLFLMISTIGVSCSKQSLEIKSKINNNDVIIIDFKDNFNKQNTYKTDTVFELQHVFKPKLTDSTVLNEYEKVKLYGDTVYIMTKNTIEHALYSFDLDGNCLFKINKRGRGPDEYYAIDDFIVNSKKGFVAILSRSQLYKYDLNGKFLGIIRLEAVESNIRNIEILDTLIYAYKEQLPTSNYKNAYSYAVYDYNGNKQYEDYPVDYNILNYNYSKGRYITSNSENIFLNIFGNDTIFSITNNSYTPKAIVKLGKYKIPPKIFERMTKNNEFIYRMESKEMDYYDYAFGIENFIVTDRFLYVSTNTIESGKYASAIHSFEDNSTVYYTYRDSPSIFYPSIFYPANSNMLYSLISNDFGMNFKKRFEYQIENEGIESFSSNDMDDYNLIKNTKEGDNTVILFFKFK